MWMAISLLGMTLHNWFELPNMPITRPEYILPSLYSLILFLGLWRQPTHYKIWEWLILIWGILHFVGGAIISVLPLTILPFTPKQSIYLITFHTSFMAQHRYLCLSL
jgi:hypothetical protein